MAPPGAAAAAESVIVDLGASLTRATLPPAHTHSATARINCSILFRGVKEEDFVVAAGSWVLARCLFAVIQLHPTSTHLCWWGAVARPSAGLVRRCSPKGPCHDHYPIEMKLSSCAVRCSARTQGGGLAGLAYVLVLQVDAQGLAAAPHLAPAVLPAVLAHARPAATGADVPPAVGAD
jgi:hypothetical protein